MMSSAVSDLDKEKDAFFVVRKGDTIGIYKDLSDCQTQVESSVFDPPVSVFKGYSLPKEAEEYLSSVGLKKPLYSVRASDLKEDLFGALTPFLLQESKAKVSEEGDASEMKSKDQITNKRKLDQHPSPSTSVEKLPKLDLPAYTLTGTCFIEFDGASKGNPGPSGAGAVLKTEDGSLILKVRQGLGITINNAAKYHALILGLKYAIKEGYRKINVKGDSMVVVKQVIGKWMVNQKGLVKLHEEVKQLSRSVMYQGK